jgi:uncharacterized cupin superfamily protein
MKQALAIIAVLATGPALAVPGGMIDSLVPGTYICELPGDATGPAGHRQDSESFTVLNASTYETADGRGTYLLTGDRLSMTSGPKAGQKFRRLSANFLRKLEAGDKEGTLRCVRRVVNNS